MNRKTLDLLFKVTVRSVIDYALPIYSNNLKISNINRLEQLQYNGAKLVTGSLKYTSRIKLNEDLGWETIRERIDFLGLNIFHKIHEDLGWETIRERMASISFIRFMRI